MVSRVIPVDTFDLVIFGATGDLARRKILPGLFRRLFAGQMPEGARIIGAARSEMDVDAFRALVREALAEFVPASQRDAASIDAFLSRLDYVTIDALGTDGWSQLASTVRNDVVTAFYFSVGPSLFEALAERLHSHGIARPDTRIVVEKPFGHDLASARALNQALAAHFDETQIYRIDHYLGKETVQNLMAVRFGNMLFEPLWNSQFVDHIQITVAETVGVGGRGEYYNRSGAMRDMVQNHLMQLLCLIAMEPPSRFEPDAVRDEKLKVIRALDPVEPHHIVRGQYDALGDLPSYREDAGDPRSRTESFVALKCQVSNWRWAGTPIYLRTGKRLRSRTSEIAVVFKNTPHSIFPDEEREHRNILTIRLQPNEGIELGVTIKEPGPGGMRLVDVPLDMSFADALGPDVQDVPDAYERLIMDVIRGNQTLFMRGDEVEAAWAWTDPIINGWMARNDVPKLYDLGSSGPEDALALLHRTGDDGGTFEHEDCAMHLTEYPDSDLMMMDVADKLAGELESALLTHDQVSFAAAGGSTPGPVYDTLSAVRLEWNRVTVLPTDERCVPADHPRSNAAMLRARLAQDAARDVHIQSLYDSGTAEEAAASLRPAVGALAPLSVVMLGMGADMHIASLFPGAHGLAKALSSSAPPLCVTRPADQPEDRISLSAPLLKGAMAIHLLITGADKRAALEKAAHLPIEEAPVRLILDTATVHWSE